MIRAILFDLDGVLVDACEWHYQALNQALLAVCDVEINRQEHVSTFNGLPTKTKLNMLTEQGRISRDSHNKVWSEKQRLTEEVINDNASTDADKQNMHRSLGEQGYMLGCVTNSIKLTAHLMLKKTGQMKFLALTVTNEDVSVPKPSPEGYIKAMAAMGVSPSEVIIVEDSDKGFAAATASGAYVLRVKNATHVNLDSILSKIQLVESESTS